MNVAHGIKYGRRAWHRRSLIKKPWNICVNTWLFFNDVDNVPIALRYMSGAIYIALRLYSTVPGWHSTSVKHPDLLAISTCNIQALSQGVVEYRSITAGYSRIKTWVLIWGLCSYKYFLKHSAYQFSERKTVSTLYSKKRSNMSPNYFNIRIFFLIFQVVQFSTNAYN